MPKWKTLLKLLGPTALVLAVASCRTGRNYPAPNEPRYGGTGRRAAPVGRDTLVIASFNIAFARNLDRAITLLSSNPDLARADIVLLQEMTADATKRIAEALDMSYVYYPAIFHIRFNQDFGNAVLSLWPIVADAKVILPHESRYATTQRTATAVSLRVGRDTVRVYSTHLGTVLDVSTGDRREQLQAILGDAARFRRVVIGGDFNASGVAAVARDSGFTWPTERGERTAIGGRWDHILLKGLFSPDTGAAGTIVDDGGVSDHRPVWAKALLRRP